VNVSALLGPVGAGEGAGGGAGEGAGGGASVGDAAQPPSLPASPQQLLKRRHRRLHWHWCPGTKCLGQPYAWHEGPGGAGAGGPDGVGAGAGAGAGAGGAGAPHVAW